MIRAFVAVELDAALRNGIARTQDHLKQSLTKAIPAVRLQWVRPEAIHLTLKFLGSIEERRVSEIQETLRSALHGQPPFTVEVGGVGVFPDLRAPRVLWLGLSGQSGPENASLPQQDIRQLAATVDRALGTIGFPPEDRPFRPHLTLARIKERSREVGQALQDLGLLNPGSQVGRLELQTVSLMKSDLKPSGAVYTRLWELPLKSETKPLPTSGKSV